MADVFEVPLQAGAQQFAIGLGTTLYEFTVTWCAPAACWILDIADSTGAAIVSGIPLITGADLLAQLAYLGIGGELIVQTDHDPDAVPTFANLGATGHLYFIVPA
jgi:hypothetical protein